MPAASALDRPNLIEARGLTKRFGAFTAVQELDFAVEPGRITGFLGPNGAGKTTTLRMLATLITPTACQATPRGEEFSQSERRAEDR